MSKPVTLYTLDTPNGYPISVALEELEVPYNVKLLSFKEKEQKSEWFLKINPNGRIPAITDHQRGDVNVFETSAILLYLTQHYDPKRIISYDPVNDPDLHSEVVQWLFFAHGGIGPMMGQAAHFLRYAPEKIPYGIHRYVEESKRLLSVIEERLNGREWLVGPHYSLADIKTFPWVSIAPWCGVELDAYPNIREWLKRIEARPKTYAGLGVPHRDNVEERLKNAEKLSKQVQELFGFKKV